MTRLQQILLLRVANLIIPLGVFIFLTGFFRGRLRTSTRHDLEVNETYAATMESAPFDKVVFMMIDALRRFVILLPALRCANEAFRVLSLADRFALPR